MLAPVLKPLCLNCEKPFERFSSFQTKCRRKACIASDLSRIYKAERAAIKAAKEQKAKDRKRLDELRPLSYWAKQAERAFNAWCRWRDRDLPCISCGTTTATAWDAGHYRSVGSCPELRYVEDNVHKQCAMNCNHQKGGNALEYRKGLIARIGADRVAWLEGPHEPKRYRADDLRAIRDEYRRRLRAEQRSSTA